MSRSTASAPRVLYVAEPPAAWLQRPPVVVDCSVLVALLWGEANAADAAALLKGRSLHAPSLLRYELANVARSKRRSGVPADVVRAGLETYAEQKVALHDAEPLPLFDLAERTGLSAYDAAYLWLAAELRAPLATYDRRLGEAAARHLPSLD